MTACHNPSRLWLSRLEDGEVIGVGNEHAFEEPERQNAIEPLGPGIFLGTVEAEEWHTGQFERSDFYVLRRQSQKHPLSSIRAGSL